MNTKTFHAASVQEAIRQARTVLGPDAMLLNSRRVTGPNGQADHFDVSFAYPGTVEAEDLRPAIARGQSVVGKRSPDQAGGVLGRPEASSAHDPSVGDDPYAFARYVHTAKDANPVVATPSKSGTAEGSTQNEAEPQEMKTFEGDAAERLPPEAPFNRLREQMVSLRREMLQLAGSVRRVGSSSFRQELPNDALRRLYDILAEQDFHPELVEKILATVAPVVESVTATSPARRRSARSTRKRNEGSPGHIVSGERTPARLMEALKDAIATYVDLMPEPGLRRKRNSPLVISLVGPPGAGKTTTLVKLAVRYSEASRFPLQIISMDNFRVGASEQLRAYSAVMGVGFDTLTTVSALERAVREYSSKEIILVDTPGLGWKDFEAGEGLANYLRSLDNAITHMVAPASMKPSDFERLADLYEAFDYQSLIYTKLDETTSIGQLVSESWRRQKPLAYFTTGQRVPDDLELASRDRICERILPADTLAANFAA